MISEFIIQRGVVTNRFREIHLEKHISQHLLHIRRNDFHTNDCSNYSDMKYCVFIFFSRDFTMANYLTVLCLLLAFVAATKAECFQSDGNWIL